MQPVSIKFVPHKEHVDHAVAVMLIKTQPFFIITEIQVQLSEDY